MKRLRRTACAWVLCLQVALLLSACSRIGAAEPPASTPTARPLSGSLWTNTFPPLQNPGAALRFLHHGLENGLSQSSVLALLQDNQGFLWVGTQDGLNRFDGYSFTVFRPDPHDPDSLSGGEILSLAQGADGALWIGTNAGLDRYDPFTRKFQRWTHSAADPDSIADNTIYVVYEDPRGVLWVGTDKGLDRFDRIAGKFVHLSLSGVTFFSANGETIRALYESDPDTLWVGTDKGLVRYSVPDGKVRRYQNDSISGTSISSNEVSSISQGQNSALWIGTHAGLDRLDPSSGQFTRFTHSDASSLADNYVQALMMDRSGQLWIGTRNGLDRFDASTQHFIHSQSDAADPTSLGSNTINTIYEDRGGVLWVGTSDAGVDEHDRSQDQFAYYHHSNVDPTSLSGNVIFPIVPAPFGKMWIGTFDAGLNLFDPMTGRSEHFVHEAANPDSLVNDTVLSLFVDGDQALWVGTHQGLDRLLPGGTTFIHYANDPGHSTSLPPGSIYSIYQDSASTYWIGTAHGLRILDRMTGECTVLRPSGADGSGLAEEPVMAIQQDRSGALWFGTDSHGLYRFDPVSKRLEHFVNDPDRPNSLSSNSVLDVYQDRAGTIWIATFGGGLDRYLPQEHAFRSYRQEQGLPNDVVYGVLEDHEGSLWLSTNLGLARFHPTTGVFDHFTVSDGLQSNEFNSGAFAADSKGTLYFGGIKGLTVFDPANIQKNPYVPPLVLTSLTTQDGKSPASTQAPETLEQVTLRYPQNSFDLSFAALSFARSQGNQYKYILEGFERTWHSAGSDHRGSYTNLPGGTYTLRILGSNSDGVWNEAGASVKVTVIPPFWQTWLFRLLAGVCLVAAAVVTYRSRVHSIEAQKTALEHMVLDRTEALQKRNLDLEALYSADERMLRVLTQDEVLQALVDLAVDTLEADKSAIFTEEAGRGLYCVRVSRGFSPETLELPAFTESQQEILSSVAGGDMRILGDGADDPSWRAPGTPVADMMRAQGFHSIMYMPITVQNAVLGIFSVYCCTSPHTFNERRKRLFASLVQRAALSIDNSRLFEETKHVAVLEERSRLAQDLHDSAKQKAFAALAQLGAAKRLVGPDRSSATEHLAEAEDIVSEVIRDLTFFIQDFYPIDLKEKGLASALRSYVFAWEKRCGIWLDLSILDERRLPLPVEQALYRILQEGLSNIARHSQASRAAVRVMYERDEIVIEIRDNGTGFDVPRAARGLGLQLMHDRAESIAGHMDIESSPGAGTLLKIRVPVQA